MESNTSSYGFNIRQAASRVSDFFSKILHAAPVERRTPIGKFSRDDIFVVGYPKSGNTWMQNIIGGMAYGLDQITNDWSVQQLVPDVHAVQSYRRLSQTMFFKSHSLPVPEYKRVIYLLRDGRDAMVSYLHYIAAMSGAQPDFLKFVETGAQMFPCKWGRHVVEWMENPHGADMITIRYEKLLADPLTELKRLRQFASLTCDDAYLEEVIRQTTFDVMREKEMKYGCHSHGWPKDRFFVRRGKTGSYIDEMPPSVMEAFLKDSGDVMRQCGYIT